MALSEEDGGMTLKGKLVIKPMLLLLIMATLTFAVYGLMQSSMRIAGTGTVKVVDVGVFWDFNCTEEIHVIDWGLVEPGSANNVTIYVRNEGNVVTTLFMYTENWDPTNATDYLELTWDYESSPLEPSEVAQVTLTLAVSTNVEGISNFSFDIIIGISG